MSAPDAASAPRTGTPTNFPGMLGVYLAVNAVPDLFALVDGPDCALYKAHFIHGRHDWESTLLRADGRHRVGEHGRRPRTLAEAEHALDGLMVLAELRHDGADLPVLGEEQSADARAKLGRDHRATSKTSRRSRSSKSPTSAMSRRGRTALAAGSHSSS